MNPGLRNVALTVHLAVSIGWIGAVVAYLTLDITVATTEDPESLRTAWSGMGSITSRAIVPLAIASLLTGLVMSLGTRWGLFRHWWVLISFLLTTFAVIVLLSESGHIAHSAAVAIDPTTSDDQLRALPNTLLHSIGGIVVLLVVQVLNLYKPRGVTRYGWRKQEEEEGRRARRQTYARSGPEEL